MFRGIFMPEFCMDKQASLEMKAGNIRELPSAIKVGWFATD
ncbi:hypothetical protein MIZ01_1187 [Sideroxyarcus emersonii]|uniref:Uncharacterized protein n=1 Tax=Sideroxyarcus emersonii TaxID=2764705 RepID=A0AAN1X9W8_9PROT|nr:hypothetical protein MIZ01_1187 [Sideroxyarcus emersonii]